MIYKVALAMAIEEALGNRRGNPTGANQYSAGNPANLPENQVVGESREIAAEAVGMKPTTYRQAKAVVNSGDDEAVEVFIQNHCITIIETAAYYPKRRGWIDSGRTNLKNDIH